MKNSTNNTTINSIVSAIRTATTSRGELLNLCRENAKNAQGCARIASACNVLLDEYRTTQAKAKGFESTEKYLSALDTRIAAKAKGSKNEKTNFLGWKCGNEKNKVAFYHVVTVALKECATNAAKDGYKPVLNKDTDFKIAIEKVIVKTPVKPNTPPNDEKPNDEETPKAEESNTNQSNLSVAISAIEALNDTDLNTLASAMVHGSNDTMKKLLASMAKIREQEKANKEVKQQADTKLVELQLKADKQKMSLAEAKKRKLTEKTIASRQASLKATNEEIAALKNSQKSISLQATQY